MAELFGTTRNNITMHLKDIFSKELKDSVCKYFLHTAADGKNYNTKYYNLDENHFDELLQEIREIRIRERNFYQKITDIYSTSLDYLVI